jgi:hypothetical protein
LQAHHLTKEVLFVNQAVFMVGTGYHVHDIGWPELEMMLQHLPRVNPPLGLGVQKTIMSKTGRL